MSFNSVAHEGPAEIERPHPEESIASSDALAIGRGRGHRVRRTATPEPSPDSANEKPSNTLSVEEQDDLKRLVGQFIRIQGLWYEGLKILLEIKERRLYRQQHADFETFCRTEFHMGKSNVNRLIQSAEVANRLATNVAKPERESHIRPLLRLDHDQQVDCYRAALETARSDNRPLNASDVAKAVRAASSPTPASVVKQDMKLRSAEVIARLTRSLIRGLEDYEPPILLLFEKAVIHFRENWLTRHGTLGLTKDASDIDDSPAPENADLPDANMAKERASATEDFNPEIKEDPSLKLPSLGHQGEVADNRKSSDPVSRSIRWDDKPRPGRRYGAITLDLPAGMTADDFRALRLHKLVESRCHILVRLNEIPAQVVMDAVARTDLRIHATTRLESVDYAEPEEAGLGIDTVVLVLNGYGTIKEQIRIKPGYTVSNPERWFEAILAEPADLFPEGLPKKVLALDAVAISARSKAADHPPGGRKDAGNDSVQPNQKNVERGDHAGGGNHE